MSALLLAYGCWQVFRWPSGDPELISDLSFVPVGLAAVCAAWMASRRCRDRPRLRWAWRLIAMACLSFAGGDIAWMAYVLAGSRPYPSAADGLYLLFYPLMLAGLLMFPAPRRTFGEWARLALDLLVVAIGGTVVVVYLVLGPTIVQSGPDVLQTAFSVAYPVGDVILLVGLASVLLRGGPSGLGSLRMIAAGLLLFVVGDLAYGYITLHGTYHGGDPVDTFWMAAMALFAVAGAAQPSSAAVARIASGYRIRSASWVPAVAVAVGFGVLLFTERQEPLLPLSLICAAVGMATLVSIRQFLAQRDLVHVQDRLSHQSQHDALTELPNRVLVIDRAEKLLARARRAGTTVAALYIDLDGFKHVNDSFGHSAGDELLQVVSRRLTGAVRESDTVGRLGGDEFVVLLDGGTLDTAPELVAERLCTVLAQPVILSELDGRTVTVTASIGIAIGRHHTADDLLRDADFALYEAKRSGKNRWTLFEPRLQTAAQDRLALKADLIEALEHDQFFLLYQPTFDLQTMHVNGVEALIRWKHPSLGVIGPGAFISIAEETGLIVAIGRWVLDVACRQAAKWHRDGHLVAMSVNVSACQLDDEGLARDVLHAIQQSGIDPTSLIIEITETALVHDLEAATRRLGALKELGVRIAIDDFGTGYSSLAYLHELPVDVLKIDRSFVSTMNESAQSGAIVHTLMELSKALGIDTLAEGIESQSQLERLQRERCGHGQGFLFAPPMPAAAIGPFLARSLPTGTGEPSSARGLASVLEVVAPLADPDPRGIYAAGAPGSFSFG